MFLPLIKVVFSRNVWRADSVCLFVLLVMLDVRWAHSGDFEFQILLDRQIYYVSRVLSTQSIITTNQYLSILLPRRFQLIKMRILLITTSRSGILQRIHTRRLSLPADAHFKHLRLCLPSMTETCHYLGQHEAV